MIKEFKDELQAKAVAESLGLLITKYKGVYIVSNSKEEILASYNLGYHNGDNIFYDRDILKEDGFGFIVIKDTTLVDASQIELPYGIKDCSYMFRGCVSLKLPPFVPNGVKKCDSTFNGCKSLKVSPIIPDSVEDCFRMFLNCPALEISPQIPDSVEDCDYMFCNCRSLKQKPQFPPNASAIDALKDTPFENGSVSQKLDS